MDLLLSLRKAPLPAPQREPSQERNTAIFVPGSATNLIGNAEEQEEEEDMDVQLESRSD